MQEREAYLERMQTQADRWQTQIHSLKAQAEMAEGDEQRAYEERIRELEEKHAEAVAKIEELEETSDDAWGEGIAGEFMAAWDELEETMAVALGRFRNF